jgi:hypothetical protein
MKTLILDPTKPPFTPDITMQRAVEWNLEGQSTGQPHRTVAMMFASLLEELVDQSVLHHTAIGRILDMGVTDIITNERDGAGEQ